MYATLHQTIHLLSAAQIPAERKNHLEKMAAEINTLRTMNPALNMCFICTHNSRRSQLAQVWATTLAHHFDVSIAAYSGGTEVTAFNHHAIAALRTQGFQIETTPGNNEPARISFDDEQPTIECFSKTWDNSSNPQTSQIAIMTCSEADAACPTIPGALQRYPLTYEDPKQFDQSDHAEEAYLSCAQQIAAELYVLFDEMSQKK